MPSSHVRKRTAKKGTRWLATFEYKDAVTGARATESKTFGKKREAEAWISEQKSEISRDGRRTRQTKISVDEYLDQWLASGTGHLAVSTQRSYTELARLYLRPSLGEAPLASVTPLSVSGLIERLSDAGLSPTTVRLAYTTLKVAMKQAVIWGLIRTDPTVGTNLPKKVESEANKAMSSAEAARFEVALEGERHEALFLTLARTGIRPGESFALRWMDLVDLDGGRPILMVTRAVQRSADGTAIFAEPKTKKARRSIRLDADVAAVLSAALATSKEAARKAKRTWSEEDLAFPSRDDHTEPLDRHATRRAFKRIAKKAGLGSMIPSGAKRGPQEKFTHDFSLYSLRHTAATLALAAGVHVQVVSANLGHKSTAFTMDTYCRDSLPEIQDDAVAKMAAFRAAAAAANGDA